MLKLISYIGLLIWKNFQNLIGLLQIIMRKKYEFFSESELTRTGFNFMFELYPVSDDYNAGAILHIIEKDNDIKEYAYIYHDKEEVKPHYHVCIKFYKPIRVKTLLNRFSMEFYNPNGSDIIISKNNWQNALNYLIHNTKDSKDKYQYSPDEVVNNIPDIINNLRLVVDDIDIFNEIADYIVEGYNPTYQNVIHFCNSKGKEYMRCFLKRSNSFIFSAMIKERGNRF